MATFINKWHGRMLQDDGCYVSAEFNKFQDAFKKAMKKLCEKIGATLVSYSKGHYDMSGFIERNGHYVYFAYSNIFGYRSQVNLKGKNAMYCRTAASNKDYSGGENNETSFEDCENVIDDLLNKDIEKGFDC